MGALSGSMDCTLRLWNLDSGTELQVFYGHSEPVLCCAFDAAVSAALSGSEDRTLRMWNLETAEIMFDFQGHHTPVNCLCADFHKNVAFAGSFCIYSLWSLTHFPFRRDTPAHSAAVTCISVNWELYLVLTGSEDRTLKLWSIRSVGDCEGKQERVFQAWSPVTCLACDWAEHSFVSGSRDGSLQLWDLSNGALLARISTDREVLCVALELQSKSTGTDSDPQGPHTSALDGPLSAQSTSIS